MSKPDNSTVADSWNTYWAGTGDVGAFSSGGVNHPAIDEFWTEFFAHALASPQSSPLRIIDVATGNGAVVELLLEQSTDTKLDITCVDISAAAIDNVVKRFPTVTGVVADALSIPRNDGEFALVTSQFGIEYAGLSAIPEAARLVAAGGQLAMVMHIEDGIVHQECSANLNAVRELQATNFVTLARAFFVAGFGAVRGGSRTAYDQAGRALAPAIEKTEGILKRYGQGIAGETISRLYNDVGTIHSQLPKYQEKDVIPWLDTLHGELDEYAQRMTSMLSAALSKSDLDSLTRDLGRDDFDVSQAEPLLPCDADSPVAWVIVAKKRMSG